MKTELNRRQFLGAALAAGASGLAFDLSGAPAILSCRSPNGKLRLACVGVSGRAGQCMKAFGKIPEVEMAALCDVDAEKLAAASKLFPGAKLYSDWREMLVAEKDLDSICVGTPDHNHTVISAAAMRRGLNVYCEKPLCKKLDECRLLERLAAESGKVTQLGTQGAASLADRQFVEYLKTGAVGAVKRVVLFSNRTGASRKPRVVPTPCAVPSSLNWQVWLGPAAERPYAPGYHPALWRVFRDFGSGWVGDLCIHAICAPWIGLDLSATAPLRVRAETDEATRRSDVNKIFWPRYSHIRWDFPGIAASGGVPFPVEWFSGISAEATTTANFLPPPEYDAVFARSPLKKRELEGMVVEGEKGYILSSMSDMTCAVLKDGSVLPPPKLPAAPSHYQDFVTRCREGGKARCDFGWATKMMETTIIGGVAEQLPDRTHVWHAQEGRFDDADATALLKSGYRAGWQVEGLA